MSDQDDSDAREQRDTLPPDLDSDSRIPIEPRPMPPLLPRERVSIFEVYAGVMAIHETLEQQRTTVLGEVRRQVNKVRDEQRKLNAIGAERSKAEWDQVRASLQQINARLEEGDERFAGIDQKIADFVERASAILSDVQLHKVKSGALAGSTVLVLDDDPMVRTSLAQTCRAAGASVLPCGTVAEARAALDSRPTAATIDILLRRDDEDGFQFVRELRADHPEIGVVLCAGNIDPLDRAEAEALGALVILKPWGSAELVEALRSAPRRVT